MTKFKLNGETVKLDADGDMPLLWALRDELKMKGTKYGCGKGLCGACTVHLNGQAVRSCSTPLSAVDDQEVTTIEGLTQDKNPSHFVGTALSKAWIEHNVAQCGYCQPGQLMQACALLQQNPKAKEQEIEGAMSGNICRCGTYTRIKLAIESAAKELDHE